jgi:hypothetical protein
MGKKKDSGYRAYQYLEPGADYRAFALAKEIDRAPEELVPRKIDGANALRVLRDTWAR